MQDEAFGVVAPAHPASFLFDVNYVLAKSLVERYRLEQVNGCAGSR